MFPGHIIFQKQRLHQMLMLMLMSQVAIPLPIRSDLRAMVSWAIAKSRDVLVGIMCPKNAGAVVRPAHAAIQWNRTIVIDKWDDLENKRLLNIRSPKDDASWMECHICAFLNQWHFYPNSTGQPHQKLLKDTHSGWSSRCDCDAVALQIQKESLSLAKKHLSL